jgi:hypothetical protein
MLFSEPIDPYVKIYDNTFNIVYTGKELSDDLSECVKKTGVYYVKIGENGYATYIKK